jgi:protein phosphatase 1G
MGIYLASPNREKHSFEDANGKVKYGASGMQGWRVNMEDSHIAKFNIAPDTHVFGVFDGHGGKEVARYVERHFVEELVKCPAFKKGEYENALNDTFLKIDELLLTNDGKRELAAIKSGDEDSKNDYQTESFAGCTACVALIVKSELYVANAGDSRCIILSGGTANALSEDHKPDLEHERERIQKAGGYIIDGRINGNLNLSRAMGDLEYKKNSELKPGEQLISVVPDVRRKTLNPDDELIVLGCDGIWECLTNQQIAEFLKDKLSEGKTNAKAVEELLDNILAPDTSTGIGCDNMTCILITLK